MRRTERSDTELVTAARGDDGEAFGELFDRWFNSSWNVARTIVRNDELAADVAQDAMLAAWQRLDQLENPDAFGGWLLRITRNRALNRLERENRSWAGGDDVVSGLRDQGLPDPTGAERPLAPDSISEVRDSQELVWAAAAALGEREVSLLDLHLRHGLSPAEIADELGVEANNAHQQLFRLRNRLGDAIGSYLLWRNGRPLCDGLAAAVGGDVAFDRTVARAVSRHQASCEHCSDRRAGLIDPSKLFAGVPLVLVPTQLKVQAAAALQSAGVPLQSGAGASGGEGGGSSDPVGAGEADGADTGGNGQGADSGGGGTDGGSQGADSGGSSQGAATDAGGSEAGGGDAGGGDSGGLGVEGGPQSSAGGVNGSMQPNGYLGGGGSGGTSPSAGLRLSANRTGRRLVDGSLTAKAGGILLAAAVLLVAAIAVPRMLSGGDETVAAIDSLIAEPDEAVAAPTAEAGDQSTGDTGPDRFDPAAPGADGGDPATTEEGPTSPTSNPATAADPTPPTTVSIRTEPTATPTAPSTTGTTSTTLTTGPRPDPPTPDPDPVPPDPDPDPPDPDPPTPDPPTPDPPTPVPPDPDPVPPEPDPPRPDPPDPDPPPPPPAEQPEIIRFAANRPSGVLLCANPNQSPFEAFWSTRHADGVTLTMPNGSHQGGPDGSYRFCASQGDTIRLLATGPGGQDKATTTLR